MKIIQSLKIVISQVTLPPQNRSWRTKLKIKGKYEDNGSNGNHKPSRRFWGLGSAIKIYNPHRETRAIYSTVIHELAHASHWRMDRNNYNNCSGKVAESWARGVEWELTRMVYPDYKGRERRTNDYTLVVADMIDDPASDHSNFGFGFYSSDYQDKVHGYTIRQIEDALYRQRHWNNWKNNIKNRYNNATENNLDLLFSSYE